MLDRFLVWLGAGLVSAGMAAAMVAGAGLAAADSPPGSDTKGTNSSESTKPTENKADSSNDDADKPKPKPSEDVTADPTDVDDTDAALGDEDMIADEPEPTAQKPDDGLKTDKDSDTAKKLANEQVKPVAPEPKPVAKPVVKQEAEKSESQETTEPAETTVEPVVAAVEPAVAAVVPIARTAKTAESKTAAVAFAAPATADITSTAAAPPFSGLLSAIGTIVFNLYGLATRLFGGPPILPANSTVTVHSSTLRIDCGEGYEVPADWYIPDTAEPPTRLIYLQHGFLASGPWYSHTAAALAEQTNSIVVAPTITSNFLSCDACWLGAPPMQRAVANLFEDDNTALAESALAADYTGPIPDRVVLVGHSLGGGLVAGTAGYMVCNDTIDRLAGVVMLDGVGLDGSMATSLDKVPDGIPIYQLAAPKYFWNQFGVGTAALLEARPDRFIGVTLVGGSHVDSMRGGNPLIQFSQQLVSGFSTPQNVEAARILMVGWVNDMFAGNQDEGIYVDPNDAATINTPAGQAVAVALPNSLTKPFLLNPLQALVPLGNGFFTFEPTCVAESVGTARCTGSMAA
jgi:outer membrane biosynthesis protein TonB/pimeloyl-ACP methyl ester carboxylesterase